jgi:hypothetical protein
MSALTALVKINHAEELLFMEIQQIMILETVT